mmetsp:Transcript_21014/g.24177  ORF Transcript_21014/g.24177 Transcript_21014/m.24177 type:complete len:411 (-) Transcript_21014:445-1677(-)
MNCNMGDCIISGMLPGGGRCDDLKENQNEMLPSHSQTWLEKKISDSLVIDDRSSFPSYTALKRLHSDLANNSALLTLLTLRMPNFLLGGLKWVSEQGDETCQHILSDSESLCDSDTSSSEYSDYSGHFYKNRVKAMDAGNKNRAPDISVKDVTGCDTWLDRHSQMLLDIIDDAVYSQDEDIQRLRLDYVVTQIDISRMARNASRHLDVASILSLPTVTFHAPTPPPCTNSTTIQESSIEESWLMVSSHTLNENSEQILTDQQAKIPAINSFVDPQSDICEHDTCVICLEKFVDGDTLRVLPCDHSFHTGCVDHWLLGTYSDADCVTTGCPTCKKHATSVKDDYCDDSHVPFDGSVPSWAFARLGDVLAKESFADGAMSDVLSCASSLSHERIEESFFLSNDSLIRQCVIF